MSDFDIRTLEERISAATDSKEQVRLLNELSKLMRLHDSEKALAVAEEAFRLAKSLGDREGMALSLIHLADGHRNCSNHKGAQENLDSASELLAELPENRSLKALYHDSLGNLLLVLDNAREAGEQFAIALDLYTLEGNRSRMAAMLCHLGKVEVRMRNDLIGLNRYKQALEIATGLGDTGLIALASHGIGTLYVELGQGEQALTYLRQALANTDESKTVRIAALHNSIASAYRCSSNFDSAIEHSHKALALYRQAQVPRGIGYTLHNLAAAHGERNEYDTAMEYLHQALAIAESSGLVSLIETVTASIGTAYWMKGELDKALQTLEGVLSRVTEKRYWNIAFSSYWALAHVHEQLGNTGEALRYYKLWAEIREQMQGRQKAEAVAALERQMEQERHEREKEIYRLQREKLELELARDRRELAALAAHLSQKNALMTSLEQKVRELDHASGSHLAERLGQELRRSWDESGQWQVFEDRFRQVHPEFVRTLLSRYPELTPTELKVCALMSLNITTKEIADILCTSVRTVEGHRRFIRRKLGLDRDANLSTFLASLG